MSGKGNESNAMKQANEIMKFAEKNGKNPSSTSKNKNEKMLGSKLSKFRQAKKGKNKGTWYPVLDEIAKKAGFPDLFNNIDWKQCVIKKVNEIIEFIKKNGRNPSQHSKNDYERKLGTHLSTFRRAKNGTSPRRWYPVLDQISKEAGYPDLFNMIDLEQEAIKQAKSIIVFIENIGRNPSSISKNKDERQKGIRLANFRRAKKGNGNKRWYPTLDELAEENGYPDLFDTRGKDE